MQTKALNETLASEQDASQGPDSNDGDWSLPQYDLTILLVEDNAVNQEVAMENLSSLGCRVDIANDGLEAVQAFESNKYDLILMDCQMPNLDGYQATARIRNIERLRNTAHPILIVALTAHAMAGDREKCLGAGMDDYIKKPYSFGDLTACFDRWCPHAKTAKPPSEAPQDEDTGPSPFDEAYVENLRTKKPEFWRRLKIAFLTHAATARGTLPLALVSRDWDSIKMTAHTYKSAAANVGAKDLPEICMQLETAALAEDFDLCQKYCAQFEAIMAAVCTAMKNERAP